MTRISRAETASVLRMAQREVITMRLTDNGIEQLQDLADDETNGNRSEMIRKLIREALASRRQKNNTQSSSVS